MQFNDNDPGTWNDDNLPEGYEWRITHSDELGATEYKLYNDRGIEMANRYFLRKNLAESGWDTNGWSDSDFQLAQDMLDEKWGFGYWDDAQCKRARELGLLA